MKFPHPTLKYVFAIGAIFLGTQALGLAAGAVATSGEPFPVPLESYEEPTERGC